jgi:hypothetical protein
VTSLDHLLPGADEAPRCADHTRAIAVDPVGTAIRADRVVLVETSLPWPKPVFDHPTLWEIDPLFKHAAIPTRLLACVPEPDTPTTVHVFDRRHTPFVQTRERRFTVHSPNELLDLAYCLTSETDGDQQRAQAELDRPLTEPVVLICTQGSHDICCGSDGARLAAAVDDLRPKPRLHRVSHTGGHRFAPTAMTLPDGRMWAYLVPEMLASVLDRTGDPVRLAQYCRGWWGADTGASQAAERAVFAQVGWDLDSLPRTVTAAEPALPGDPGGPDQPGSGSVTAEVAVGGNGLVEVFEVDVEAARTVPTVTCRAVGGRPAKPAIEYRARVVGRRPGTVNRPIDGG